MQRISRAGSGILAILALLPSIAFAAPVVVPPSAQPGQFQQHLQIEEERPPVSSEPLITLPDQHGKKNAGGPAFVLHDIAFENLTVFTKKELEADYREYLDKEITLSTLNDIAFKITVRYRNAGYILSRAVVPPQHIEGGIAKIRIIEGYINKVTFEGLPKESGLLNSYADKIRNARPLNAKNLERYLLLMEDLPGVSAHATLRPAPEAPGASDVIITISEKKVDGSVTFDNRGTRFMGPLQAGVTVNANNIFGWYDRTQFHGVQTGEFNELHYGEIVHEEQLDSEGTKLSLAAGYTRTHPTYTLAAFDIEGWDELFSAVVSHPFIRTRQSNLFGNVEFDIHDTRVDTLGSQLYNDRLRVLRVGGSYDFVDPWTAVNKIQTQISQGLPWDSNDQTTSSRASGRTDFLKATFEASRLQPLWGPFDLSLAAAGQWSSTSLLIAEQFAIGGADFGSAYDPSEITGDSGLAARAELRYNRDGDLQWIPHYQFYIFYDTGIVYNRDTLPGTSESTSLSDAGLGLRFNADRPLSGNLELADPLTRVVAADGKSGYRPRVFFSLAYRY